MSRLLQQVRAIVRANQALRGRDVVWHDAMAMLTAAVVLPVLAFDLVTLAAVLGGGR